MSSKGSSPIVPMELEPRTANSYRNRVNYQKGCCNLFKSDFCSNLSLEPMMLFHMIGLTCQLVVLQNFYIDRICRVIHKFPEHVCANLTHQAHHNYEEIVQATAAEYTLYRQLIESGFPVIFAVFVGPWSDKYGTKLPMLLAMSGFLFSAGFYLVFSLYPNAHPATLLICAVPCALAGGMVTVVICVFSYIASHSTEKNRSYRIAMVEGAWWLGSPIGLILGAEINLHMGVTWVFGLAVVCYGCALFVGNRFMIEDPGSKMAMPKDRGEFCAEIFNLRAVGELFATCFRPREGKRRRWIMLLVVSLNLRLLSMMGMFSVLYLYTRIKFDWDFFTYSKFAAADSIIGVIGLYMMILIALKWLKLKDQIVGLLCSVSLCLSALVLSASSGSWMIYFASILQMPASLTSTSVRSLLSKLVSKKELGKIYSFLASGEAVMPLIAAPLFNLIYKRNLTTFPGAVFLVSAGLSLMMVISFVYLIISMGDLQSPSELEVSLPGAEETATGSNSRADSDSEDDGINIEVRGSRFDKIEIFSLVS